MTEDSFIWGITKRVVEYKEAKEIIEEYPEDEYYIQAYYRMWFSPNVGMDDNSIDLHHFWHKCKQLVNKVESNG